MIRFENRFPILALSAWAGALILASGPHPACVADEAPRQQEGVSDSSPALRDEWIDPDTGHRVVRLSRLPGRSVSLYFHQNAFTREGDKLVFENTAPGAVARLFVLDWATRKLEPIAEPGARNAFVGPWSRKVYYQRRGEVYATHLDTHETKHIGLLPPLWRSVDRQR